ncbi:MAG: hypothetical protein IJ741_06945 [Schwartzia sp.]|nr:hypothetical protein [Schwartzia sp. (in: firmicutes)]
MWTKKSSRVLSFMCAVLLLCLPSVGICSEAQATGREETVTVSMQDWNTLKANNAAQKKALQESQAALTEARKELTASQTALTEARELLELSQMTSAEAQEKLLTLLKESELQKAEIEKLRQELTALKSESLTASDALTKANQYLSDTKKEIEANEATHRKRENQLERQRLLWQIVAVLIGGVAVAK